MIDTRNPNIEFNALERCDRCGQQAIASADKEGFSTLLFCGHCIKKHNLALEMSGWVVSFDYAELERRASGNFSKVPA